MMMRVVQRRKLVCWILVWWWWCEGRSVCADPQSDDADYGDEATTTTSSSLLQAQIMAGRVKKQGTKSTSSVGGLIWSELQVDADRSASSSSSQHHHSHEIILQRTSGMVYNGEIVGLLGPSGSGKSTFLSTLANMCPLHVQGTIGIFHHHDEERSDDMDDNNNELLFQIEAVPSRQVAYLQQHDDFFTQLTVQETLDLAAYMELPHVRAHERSDLVQQTCSQLGLQHTLHRQVGDIASESSTKGSHRGGRHMMMLSPLRWWRSSSTRPTNKTNNSTPQTEKSRRGGGGGRLSGGERRRLSVALELLSTRQLLLIADEPTTGLDASYSVTVMKLIKDMAVSRNIPAICSLHQPRSSIWMSLDAVILMAPGGRICYSGPRDVAIPYFESLGHILPKYTNPAEFLIDLVSIDSEDPIQANVDEERIANLASAFRLFQQQQWADATRRLKRRGSTQNATTSNSINYLQSATPLINRRSRHGRSLVAWIPRLLALWKRSWRQNVRDMNLNVFRLVACIGNALLLAAIFPTVSVNTPVPLVNSIADRVALLSFGAINLCMMAYMKAVTLFAQERPVVRREQIREHYTVLEYLVAKVLAEMPLDVAFTAVFTTVLKQYCGLQITWKKLTSTFALLTTAGASLGYFIGSVAPSDQYAATGGIPLLVILMVVGIINPSGVDPNSPPPPLVSWLKRFSPFRFAIEALCLGEYPGVKFSAGKGNGGWFTRLKNAPRMGGLALVNTGDQVIEALGLKGCNYEGAMKQLAYLSAGYLLLSWFGLLRQQFQRRRIQRHGSAWPVPSRSVTENRPSTNTLVESAKHFPSTNASTKLNVPTIPRL